jgi:hypothetical protein
MKEKYDVELMAKLIKDMMKEEWFIEGLEKARKKMEANKNS